jgi:hypothetical protein
MSLFDDLSLIALYNCDGDAVDYTGITGDATPVGAIFTSPGKLFSQSSLFDRIDDRWVIPAVGIDRDDEAFSVGGWLNFTNGIGNIEVVVACGTNAGGVGFDNLFNFHFRRNADGTVRFAIGKTAVWEAGLTTNSAVLTSAATDYHVIITYDGSKTFGGMNIYVDGSAQAVTSDGSFGAVSGIHDAWFFGNFQSFPAGLWYGGKQNQMIISNIEVSAASISALYNGGSGIDITSGGSGRKFFFFFGEED